MAKKDRFEKIYTQGAMSVMEIWVDKETGVNYVYHQSGHSGGMTPLLDSDGNVIIQNQRYGFLCSRVYLGSQILFFHARINTLDAHIEFMHQIKFGKDKCNL